MSKSVLKGPKHTNNVRSKYEAAHYCIEYQKNPFPERVFHNEEHMKVMMYIQKMLR